MRSSLLLLAPIAGLAAAFLACTDSGYTPPLVTEKPDTGTDDAQVQPDSGTPDSAPPVDGGAQFVGVCSPTANWIKPKLVDVNAQQDFGSITPDETTIAWIEGNKLYWADRKTGGDPWGNANKATVVGLASTAVALSADGLRAIVVIDNGKNFGEIVRATKADGFTADPDPTMFSSIGFALSESPPGSKLDDPVLAKDGNHLYFTLYMPNSTTSMRASSRGESTAKWTLGTPIVQPELALSGAQLRKPTGISTDRLTLFYWDQVDGAEHAAFRFTESDDFTIFVNLGTLSGGQVDATCNRLYYATPATFEYLTRQ